MKRVIKRILSALFFLMEAAGFFFTYALAVYWITDGAMVGKMGVLMMLIASVASAFGLIVAILKTED